MERYAWRAKIKNGMHEEYIKRHNEIWGELVELLKKAGIENYSIWMQGDEIFGYYECRLGRDFAARKQAESPIVDKWNEYMKDVMTMVFDERTGAQALMNEVFYLK